jgi:hypothetical protein
LRQGEVKSGWNVFDNNLLACGEDHVEAVFGMLRKQRRGAVFSGGLDAEIFNEEHARLLRSIRVAEMWFACDRPGALENLKKVAELLPDFSPRKRRCYVLVGYDGESLREAEKRCRQVYEAGFWPFAQLFRGEGEERRTKSREWSKLVKTSSVQTGDV